MKKKLMMVAVLLGALTLGACVDDNESASVTAIRNAKAAQLESIAAVNNANAAAITAAAEAEAAIKAAQARLKAAQADKAEQELEEAKQEFALELEKLQAEYAARIAEYNAQKAYFEKELWAHVDAHITNVYAGYTAALGQVQNLTRQKLEQQVQKAQTEAGIITAEETVEQILAGLNIEKIQKERELAKWTAMKEAQPSKDEYLKMLDELETKAYDILNNQRPEALAEEKAANEAYEDATEAVEEGDAYKFVAAAEALNELATDYSTATFISTHSVNLAEDEVEAYKDENSGSAPELSDGTTVDFTVDAYNYVDYTVEAATLALERAIERELDNKAEEIEDATGKAWEEDDDENLIMPTGYWDDANGEPASTTVVTVNDAKSEQTYWAQQITAKNAEISDLEDDLADAEEAENESEIERIQGLIDAANADIKTYNQYKEDAAVRELKANAEVKKLEEEKAEIEADQKTFTEQLAVLNDATAQKEYTDAVAALETPAVALVEAISAVKPFNDQLEEMGFETNTTDGNPTPATTGGDYNDIKGLLDGIYDVQIMIDVCNNRLAEIEASLQLGDLNYLVSEQTKTVNYYNPITNRNETLDVTVYVPIAGAAGITPEDAVAMIDMIIAQLDEAIKVQQARADQYKADLEALVNASEETPAA